LVNARVDGAERADSRPTAVQWSQRVAHFEQGTAQRICAHRRQRVTVRRQFLLHCHRLRCLAEHGHGRHRIGQRTDQDEPQRVAAAEMCPFVPHHCLQFGT
jgi:hypothetical protein